MLRLSTDHIRVYLHPQRLVMVRLSGWLKPKVVAQDVITGWTHSAQSLGYTEVLAALAQQLKRAEWQHAHATVVLSGHGAHYRIAPWNPTLTLDEQQALLRHRYAEVFGTDAAAWKISLCDAGFGKQGLACAVDGGLLDKVKEVFAASTVRLGSIRPMLMEAFNGWRGKIETGQAWFILLESGWLTAGLRNNNGWAGIRSLSLASWPICELEAGLEIQLQRWAMQFGEDEAQAPIYLFCVDPQTEVPTFSATRGVVKLAWRERAGQTDIDEKWAPALCT